MAKAADRIRHVGQFERRVAVGGVQGARERFRQGQVVGGELPLHAALGRLAEDVQPGPTHALHRRQRAERQRHPGAKGALLQAALRIAAGERGRRQVIAHAVVAARLALELRAQPVLEGGIGIQASDLVFILVGHELGQVARHGPRHSVLLVSQGGFARAHGLHRRQVAAGIGVVLVGAHMRRQPLDQGVQGLGQRHHALGRLRAQRVRPMMRRLAAQFERGQVLVHRHAVDLDRAAQAFQR
ncbi:hypothetical protein D3C87_882830 [compost metagenome]